MTATRTPILLPVEAAPAVKAPPPALQRVAVLLASLLIACVPAVAFREVVPRAAQLYGLATWPNAYLVLDYAGLLYGALPLVLLSTYVLLLAPGILLALALGVGERVERVFLHGLALSLVLVSAAAAIAQALLGSRIHDGLFVGLLAGLGLAAAAVLALVAWRRPVALPDRREVLRVLPPLALAPLALFLVLEPKYLWEAFNGDGAHAFEAARLLLRQSLPFFDPSVPNLAPFPGLTSMTFAYPASWFVRLFGQLEVAARLPFPLALAGVWAGTVEVARLGRGRMDGITRWLLWAGLVPFTLALAYSASFSPFSADIAMPAAQDTLLIALFLGAAAAFLEGRSRWFALFAALTLASMPNGLLLLGMLLAATPLFLRPVPVRRVVLASGMVAALVGALAALALLLPALGLPRPGREYGAAELLRYFLFVQWLDWRRAVWVLVACGIVPVIALFAWRRQDGIARTLTAVVVAYFLFFYFQGITALHHFSPVMVLPLAIWARVTAASGPNTRRAFLLAMGLGAVAATALSWPTQARPFTAARGVGVTLVDGIGGYQAGEPAALRRTLLLASAIPPEWDPLVPGSSFGMNAVAWSYYAAHAAPGTVANYLIQPDTARPPAGWRRIASRDGAALELRSDGVLAAQRGLRPATYRGSPIYDVPRGMLFHTGAADPRLHGMERLLRRLGLDPARLAKGRRR